MSSTIATLAGTTGSGLGSERHVIWAINDAQFWAFGYTSTATLASWSSPDGVTWTAGATHALSNAHGGDGRNLEVGYLNAGGLDIVQFGICWPGSNNSVSTGAVRATIAAGVVTYHSTDTSIRNDGASDASALFWLGSSVVADSNNRWYFGNGRNMLSSSGYGYDNNNARSSVDPLTAESATPVTWTQQDIDNSDVNESRSNVLVDLGAGTMGLLSDDGNGAAATTGINWYTWGGSSWAGTTGNQAATGAISSIDKNDWSAIRVSATDIHLVYRSGATSYVHRRYNGSSWGAGATISTQASKAGGGIALSTDGVDVILSVIDSDASNTVRSCRWEAATGLWDAWTASETSTATRTFLGAARDLVNNTLLLYWTEGSSLVAAAIATFSDPPGPSTRVAVSQQPVNTAASSTTLVIVFDSAQPVAGNKVAAIFGGSGFAGTPTVTSVVDNATSPNSYTAGPLRVTAAAQGIWGFWLDLPVTATWSGNYQITVTMSTSITELSGGAVAYGGVVSGAPTATNNNGASSSSATGGAVNPSSGLSTYLVGVTNNSGANPATLTYASPFTRQVAETNGATFQVFGLGDAINSTGSQNPAVTLEASLAWVAISMAWVNANVAGPAPPRIPVWQLFLQSRVTTGIAATQIMRMLFRMRPQSRQMTDVPAVTVQNLQQALAGGLSFTGAIPARAATRGLPAALSFSGSIPSRAVGRPLAGALSFSGAIPTRAIVRALAAALSFAGSLPRRLVRSLTAALSFSGSLIGSRFFVKALTAALSFSGAQLRQPRKTLAASLSFAGSLPARSIGKALASGLSFAAAGPAYVIRKVVAAALGFAGVLVGFNPFGVDKPLGPPVSVVLQQAGRAIASLIGRGQNKAQTGGRDKADPQ